MGLTPPAIQAMAATATGRAIGPPAGWRSITPAGIEATKPPSKKTIRYAGSIFEAAAPMAGNEAAPGVHPARARPLTSGGTGTGMFRPPPFHKPFHNGKRYPP
jgi:hypothetical protein